MGRVFADLSDFLETHGPHGPLTADATEPAWNGYLLITSPAPATSGLGAGSRPLDLLHWALLN
jgi:hypothetical protein